METQFLLSPTKPLVRSSPSSSSSPLFLSYKTPLLQIHKRSVKSQFLGKSLVLQEKSKRLLNRPRKVSVPFGPIRAFVNRRKEYSFDNVIERDKKMKLVLKIRRILVAQPYRVMLVRYLGKFRRHLGVDKKRGFVELLMKFPAVFEIVEEQASSLKFKLTPEAERLYFEELKVRNEMENLLVVKIRKLLMMSKDKRILVRKIAYMKNDLGLPSEFCHTICRRYPQYFRVVKTERGPALELTHWDPELAVSAAELSEEDNRARELEERDLIIDRPPKFNRVRLPKGLILSKGNMRKLRRFRDIPYISPYSDFSGLRSSTMEKEKYACAVVHEILSLTTEKKILVRHFTHFREEFGFCQRLRGMLMRHPEMFYVSLKGDLNSNSVFLREAYRDSQLIDKDQLTIIKEKFRSLVDVRRFPRRGAPIRDESDEPEDEAGETGEEWSSVEDLMTDDGFDDDVDDDDEEDDWSDEDDDTPLDFDEDGGETVSIGVRNSNKLEANLSRQDKNKVLVPVLPDGRPRECW